MDRFKIEIKGALFFVGALLIWMVLTRIIHKLYMISWM